MTKFSRQVSLILFAVFGLGTFARAQSTKVSVVATEPQQAIYHSPQTPGYTAWCNLWRTSKGELRLAFQQVTGPVENWSKRKNVTVILGSSDSGATWKPIREVPARTNEASA